MNQLLKIMVALIWMLIHQTGAYAQITFSLDRTPQFPFNVFAFELPGTNIFLIQESTDLIAWRPYCSVFAKISSFKVGDRFLTPGYPVAQFYKVTRDFQSPFQMETNWRALNIRKYRYHFMRVCFCPPYLTLSGDITVQDGQIVLIENTKGGGNPVNDADPAEFKSIEQLFVIAQDQFDKADLTLIRYDPQFSYPTSIDLDYHYQAEDDGVQYFASNLVVIE